MASSDELRAQLEVVELEEKLVAAKDTKKGPSQELKQEVRDARQQAREARDASEAGNGVARPETVKAKSGVNN